MANNSLADLSLGLLLFDRDQAEALGQNALKVVRENLGAIEKTVEMIVEQLDGTDVYIAPKRAQLLRLGSEVVRSILVPRIRG